MVFSGFKFLAVKCLLTFCSLAKWRTLKHFAVNQAQTLIDVQSLIEPMSRHFWVGAVIGRFSCHCLWKFKPKFVYFFVNFNPSYSFFNVGRNFTCNHKKRCQIENLNCPLVITESSNILHLKLNSLKR